jgi:hypothetical protein
MQKNKTENANIRIVKLETENRELKKSNKINNTNTKLRNVLDKVLAKCSKNELENRKLRNKIKEMENNQKVIYKFLAINKCNYNTDDNTDDNTDIDDFINIDDNTDTYMDDIDIDDFIDSRKVTKTKKYKKQKIPKNIRNIVWDTHMGSDFKKGLCCCCNTEQITFVNFQCGHIESEVDGGETHVDNLLPICQSCNGSMGCMNMNDYKEKYGLM